jgi:hypothetical protein
MFLIRLLLLPFRIVFKLIWLPARIAFGVGRLFGYGRLFVLGLGVAVGLALAPTAGRELRDKVRAMATGG